MAALGTASGGPLGITALGGTRVCPGAITPGPPEGMNCWALGASERVGCWAEAATGVSTTYNTAAAAIPRSRAPFPTTLTMDRPCRPESGQFQADHMANPSLPRRRVVRARRSERPPRTRHARCLEPSADAPVDQAGRTGRPGADG